MAKDEMNVGFLDAYQGAGLEELRASDMAVTYLGLSQKNTEGIEEVGQWFNSATKEAYGESVEVVVLSVRTVWIEKEQSKTVARYAPRSIPVETRMPPKGKRGFPKMYNPETGNEVFEVFAYAILLKEHPEVGILYYIPALTSMSTCKQLNSLMFSARLPNGNRAPIFGYSYTLIAGKTPNPQSPNEDLGKLVKVVKGSLLSEEFFSENVQTALDGAGQSLLAITADAGSSEE